MFLDFGIVFGFLAVVLGAFGAHALKRVRTPDEMSVYQTGVLYQMFHTAALLVVGLLLRSPVHRVQALQTAGWLFVVGILLFSGSLYGISLFRVRKLGAITPIGGLSFLAGWAALFIALM